MHTVELLLDEGLEAWTRGLWRRLREAGLPSLDTHRHPTNRPHLTLLSAAALEGLPPLPLPVEVELQGARMLGRALVLGVRPAPAVTAVRALAWAALDGVERWPAPVEWVPHVSLALKVPVERRAAAVRLFGDLEPMRGWCTAARSYDTVTRTVVGLS
ncbi:2'-5' RNA ligase family protein [Dactylosporangium sp. NPDC051541]|uniref:2'-5' RNA ligase family protein n=1 Tax=Dactylosporangium sp. NPDC051541 TaxID=3363977 RepID=UPI0037AA7EDA